MQYGGNIIHQMDPVVLLFPEKPALLVHGYRLGIAGPGEQVQTGPAQLHRFGHGMQNQGLAHLAVMVIGPDIE
ncbi:hypothetical protein D3C75_1128660 [compost metagenome]